MFFHASRGMLCRRRRESEQLMSLMCNSSQKLPEEDKLMVIQPFKTMLHEIIYRIARENQFLKKAFIEKVRHAEPHPNSLPR